MSSVHTQRLAALQRLVQPHQAALLTDPKDITYFSGFETLVPEEREAFLVVTTDQAYLLYASFSPLPPLPTVTTMPGCDPQSLLRHFQQLKTLHQLELILVDTTKIFVHEYQVLETLPDCRLTTLDKTWTWKIRVLKDELEQQHLKQASQIAGQAFDQFAQELHAGMTELEAQLLLEHHMRQLGSTQPAFPTIVAFGPHGALPHHQPSQQSLEPETAVLVDFGATSAHYRSDMTRSWWFGHTIPAEFLKIRQTVTEAYEAVMSLAKTKSPETLTAADLDKAARGLITQAGYGNFFIHTTGHGVGLDIHEPPSVSGRNPTFLKPGMVITIEPGIYLEGQFGYRYENTVLVTETGLQELTTSDTIA